MLHLRRTRPRRAAATISAAALALWDRMVAADPGILRLLMAARGTTAVFLTSLATIALAKALGAPSFAAAPGITFALLGAFFMREPTRQQRERSLLLLTLPAAGAALATTLLRGAGLFGDGFFLALVFFCFLLQARSPRAIGLGLMAVIACYVGLFLDLPAATLPAQLLSIALAWPVTWFACFVLMPLRPAAQLRRTIQAVQGRAAAVLDAAGRRRCSHPAASRRLQRRLARLTEAALAADDQLALLDPAGSIPTRLRLMDLELSAARLATLPAELASERSASRQAAQFVVHQRRLRRSRWSARDLTRSPVPPARSPIAAALAEITRAASALGQAAQDFTTQDLAPGPALPPQPAVPGPLGWRIALRVTLASALAMAGGMAISPQRWFWAVITTYVVFLNTRSRGDTVFRGLQRVSGTLLGLVGGVLAASVLQGDGWVQAVLLFAAIFGMYYFFLISYTLAIFFVTVLLGQFYDLLGSNMDSLLVLRMEETAVGAAAAIVVAVFVLPVRTRDQVARSGAGVLRALAEVVGACRSTLAGKPGVPSIMALRMVDRQLADLRLALLPLSISRVALRRFEVERPIPALLDCVHWARLLAVAATGPDPVAATRAESIEQRLAALATGERPVIAPSPRSVKTGKVAAAIEGLDRATAVLAERLTISALHGFSLEG